MTTWLDTRTGSSMTSQKPSALHENIATPRTCERSMLRTWCSMREVGVHRLMPVLLGSSRRSKLSSWCT
jgi:hypothetical protein